MDHKEIQQSIVAVAQAIERLNRAFERRAQELKQAEKTEELERWMKATRAMRDSGNIYLAWANHYARSIRSETAKEESELGEFLDEGGP